MESRDFERLPSILLSRMSVSVFEYVIEKKVFVYVGFGQTVRMFFNMMQWRGLDPDYEVKIDQAKVFYYCKHGKGITYHNEKQGLLDELKQIGVIS